VTSNRDRQRTAARARLERQMQERADAAQQRRRRIQMISAGAAALIVLAGTVWLVTALGGDDNDGKDQAAGDPSASEAAACTYAPQADPSASPAVSLPPEIKDVGTPPPGEPHTGSQLMTLTTNLGTIKVAVETANAPCTAASFTYLAGKKFFDNTQCHRLTTSGIYVLQCGDPSASGRGGPAYQYADENLPANRRPAYPEGTFAMANSGPGTNGSQFFIVYQDSELPANYTVLGKLVEGLDLVKRVAEAGTEPVPDSPGGEGDGAPKQKVTIISMTLSEVLAATPTAAITSPPAVSPSSAPAVSGSASTSAVPSGSASSAPPS